MPAVTSDESFVDDPMPESKRRRVRVYPFVIHECADEVRAIRRRGAKIPYLFSLFSISGAGSISCAAQAYVYKNTDPPLGDADVLGMWEMGAIVLGAIAVIFFAWWLSDRGSDGADMDALETRIRELDYKSEPTEEGL